eukprot:TRINITY_DN49656_c0_g1_i1.p1 TRINITY_DN49656_c0_g1~~TRINITY_DN49656_c0_g1_i1.p1  ORF type:complete len:342 (-),score=45.89 TRINITY_DN49656_c0_g1_i1:148-1110(-)
MADIIQELRQKLAERRALVDGNSSHIAVGTGTGRNNPSSRHRAASEQVVGRTIGLVWDPSTRALPRQDTASSTSISSRPASGHRCACGTDREHKKEKKNRICKSCEQLEFKLQEAIKNRDGALAESEVVREKLRRLEEENVRLNLELHELRTLRPRQDVGVQVEVRGDHHVFRTDGPGDICHGPSSGSSKQLVEEHERDRCIVSEADGLSADEPLLPSSSSHTPNAAQELSGVIEDRRRVRSEDSSSTACDVGACPPASRSGPAAPPPAKSAFLSLRGEKLVPRRISDDDRLERPSCSHTDLMNICLALRAETDLAVQEA